MSNARDKRSSRLQAGFCSQAKSILATTILATTGLVTLGLIGLDPNDSAWGEAMWTTYHRDAGRSGDDAEGGEPLAPTLAWQSQELDGATWDQPLVLGERVYIATAADQIYALDASSGKVVWQKGAGEPVPSTALPCGDIEPTVGFVGTPVIDPTAGSAGVLYAVADVWHASEERAEHVLKGYGLSDGAEVLSTPVDPPGTEPKQILQRTALTLDSGQVVFGFGGNDGDCGSYRGAVVAAPEGGQPPRFWQYPPQLPSLSGGAVWGASGPVVDGEGEIFAATGNPNPSGGPATVFDYSDSLLSLAPATDLVFEPSREPAPHGWFEPPSWEADSNSDLDLGSAGPELLPGGVLFQAGKNGTGYLLETAMHGASTAIYEHEVCSGAMSFGGDAYADGTIYVPCTTGLHALSYDPAQRTFTSIWKGPAAATGPPIVAGGMVWSVATWSGGAKLFGLDPATGAARYTLKLPSPVSDHFASPSAAGGRLFLATGDSVTAYQITTTPSEPTGGSPGQGPGTPAAPTSPAGQSTARLSPTPLLLRKRLRMGHRGRVRLLLRCPASVASPCAGTLTLRAVIPARGKGYHGHRSPHVARLVMLARSRYGPSRGVFSLLLGLNHTAAMLLRRYHGRLELRVTLTPTHGNARTFAAVLR